MYIALFTGFQRKFPTGAAPNGTPNQLWTSTLFTAFIVPCTCWFHKHMNNLLCAYAWILYLAELGLNDQRRSRHGSTDQQHSNDHCFW